MEPITNKNEQEKKLYVSPSIKVMELNHRANLLGGSGEMKEIGLVGTTKDYLA